MGNPGYGELRTKTVEAAGDPDTAHQEAVQGLKEKGVGALLNLGGVPPIASDLGAKAIIAVDDKLPFSTLQAAGHVVSALPTPVVEAADKALSFAKPPVPSM
jgi:hypothetical protein